MKKLTCDDAGQLFIACIYALPEAENFPPGGADGEVDEDGDGGHDEAVTPPLALTNVVCAKVDGGAAVTVVSEGDWHIREDTEDDGHEQRRCADGHGYGDEGSIEGTDTCRDAGKGVMDVRVEQQHDEEGDNPVKAQRGDEVACACGNPFDDAGFRQGRGQSHQRAHPEHRIPGTFLGDDILPVDDVEDNHDADSNHRDSRGANMRETGGGPEKE